jgi:hypothetical protein
MVCDYIDRIDRPIIRNLIDVFNIMEIFQWQKEKHRS